MNRDFFMEQGWDCFYAGGCIDDSPYAETDARNFWLCRGFNNAKCNSELYTK